MFAIDKTVSSFINCIRKTKAALFMIMLSLFISGISFGDENGMILIIPGGAEQIGMAESDTSFAGNKAIMFWDPAELAGNNSLWHRGVLSTLNQPLLNSSDSLSQVFFPGNKPKGYEIGGSGIINNPSRYLQGESEEN